LAVVAVAVVPHHLQLEVLEARVGLVEGLDPTQIMLVALEHQDKATLEALPLQSPKVAREAAALQLQEEVFLLQHL
jgi:hypothetical protein